MSWNANGRHLRTVLFGAAVVCVFATVFWYTLPKGTAASGATSAPTGDSAVTVATSGAARDAAQPRRESASTTESASSQAPIDLADSEVATVAQYVAKKYQFLLDDLGHLPATQVARIRDEVLRRELADGAHDAAAATAAETRLRGLLRPADYTTYEALRDSDQEQFQLDEYAGGISNVAPLSASDRKAILVTKLGYKQRFRELVASSGLQRTDLSKSERAYAYSNTARAMQDYKRSYLQEVRQYLSNDEQFALLSNYENTEFEAELDRLKALAGGS